MTAPSVEAAAAASPVAAAGSARVVQAAISAAAMRDAARLWPLLDARRLTQTFPGWLQAMIQLTARYRGQSAQAAAASYRAARQSALHVPTPTNLIRFAPDPDEDWLARAFGYAGPALLERDTARPGTALSTTLGTTSRIVQDAGRTTILDTTQADPKSVGWYRVSDGHPCAFCALLCSRGVVYKHDTAGFQAHNDCGCTAHPAFSDGAPLPALTATAMDVYLSRGSGPALPAFRKAWAAHQAQQ